MLLKTLHRTFAKSNRFAKGMLGNEGSLSSNFAFPRHKELFNEGYYNGDGSENFEDDTFVSPVQKAMEKADSKNQNDDFTSNTRHPLDIEGGIMQNYRKVAGQSIEEVMNSDYF